MVVHTLEDGKKRFKRAKDLEAALRVQSTLSGDKLDHDDGQAEHSETNWQDFEEAEAGE